MALFFSIGRSPGPGTACLDWLVHVVFTWCVAQYTSPAPAGAVTETLKELAGLRPRLVDSNE
ncbi:hypothetical protein GCM10010264_55830 [Streptomyces globisporus]|nr:hypothetical protein GCM10010264_55830 [Streptomyces globisporus]